MYKLQVNLAHLVRAEGPVSSLVIEHVNLYEVTLKKNVFLTHEK